MTKFNVFRLKNEMLCANFIALTFVHKPMFKAEPLPEEVGAIPIVDTMDKLYSPSAGLQRLD